LGVENRSVPSAYAVAIETLAVDATTEVLLAFQRVSCRRRSYSDTDLLDAPHDLPRAAQFPAAIRAVRRSREPPR
jgi:hypothetical protein